MSANVISLHQRVTVIGNGFATVAAVRKLRALDRNVEITVIGHKPEFVFYPSLIWIPTGLRQGADLIVPLERFFQPLQRPLSRSVRPPGWRMAGVRY